MAYVASVYMYLSIYLCIYHNSVINCGFIIPISHW